MQRVPPCCGVGSCSILRSHFVQPFWLNFESELLASMAPKKKPRLVDALHEPDSKLAFSLLRKWPWGHISANEVKEIDEVALHDQEALLTELGLAKNFREQVVAGLGQNRHPRGPRWKCTSRFDLSLGQPASPRSAFRQISDAYL